MRDFFQKAFGIVTTLALALAPLAPFMPQAEAASYINTAVPSNTNNASGLVLQYSFDGTKFNVRTGAVTDESASAANGTYTKIGNTTATVYIDGTQAGTGTVEALGNGSGVLNVGRYGSSGGGYYFNGKIDDVRVYNRALSASEVTRLYGLGN